LNFSERYGYKSVKDKIQIDGMDEDLRVGLWNILQIQIWDKGKFDDYKGLSIEKDSEMEYVCECLWQDYFKENLDTLNNDWRKIYAKLKDYFFSCEWYETYDFLEFVAANHYYNTSRVVSSQA